MWTKGVWIPLFFYFETTKFGDLKLDQTTGRYLTIV